MEKKNEKYTVKWPLVVLVVTISMLFSACSKWPREAIVESPFPNATLTFTPQIIDANENLYEVKRNALTSNSKVQEYALVKYAPSGQQLWQTLVMSQSESADDISRHGPVQVTFDVDGNIYVLATAVVDSISLTYGATEFSDYDWSIAKFDPLGLKLWEQRVSSPRINVDSIDIPMTMHIAENGNLHVVGTYNTNTYYPAGQASDAVFGSAKELRVASFDSTGNQLWLTPVTVANVTSRVQQVLYAANNIYLVLRESGGRARIANEIVVHYDALGVKGAEIQLVKPTIIDQQGAFEYPSMYGVDSVGNLLVLEYEGSNYQYKLQRWSLSATQLWESIVTYTDSEQPERIFVNSLGETIIQTTDLRLVKYDVNGQEVAQRVALGGAQYLMDEEYRFDLNAKEQVVFSFSGKACTEIYIICIKETSYWQEVKLIDFNLAELAKIQYLLPDPSPRPYVQFDPVGNVYIDKRKYLYSSLVPFIP